MVYNGAVLESGVIYHHIPDVEVISLESVDLLVFVGVVLDVKR